MATGNKKRAYNARACLDKCLKAKHKGQFGNPCLICVAEFVQEQVEIEREEIAQIATDWIRSELPFVDVPAAIRARSAIREASA